MARVRAALRRSAGAENEEEGSFDAGDFRIDLNARRVHTQGREVRLTPKEFDLLVLLARHFGRVITHRQMLTAVWGPAHASDTQYLRVFIGQLRQKIEIDPADPKLILTEPGVGYRVAETE